jgi:membrane peptidoglycan carboxypeptidase
MMHIVLEIIATFLIRSHRPWAREFSSLVTALTRVRVQATSENLARALVAAEDRRFWSHSGLDYVGAVRALVRTLFFGRREGASTVEQQLVRVVTGRREITLARKLREVMFAVALGRRFRKRRLLELYLACAYFGYRMNGVEECCRTLGFAPARASRRQAAAVAARLKYPEASRPSSAQARRVQDRTVYVLRVMSLIDHDPAWDLAWGARNRRVVSMAP